MLHALNWPQENRWAIGKAGTAGTLFGLGAYAEMFNAPNQWRLEGAKLIRDRETEEYKAAAGYLRDLFADGLYPPDAPTTTNSRAGFVGKKLALSVESQGNSWVDFWQRGLQQNPPTRFAMLPLFSATAGQKPTYYLSPGYNSMNVLRKASPDRIKEILRVMKWLAVGVREPGGPAADVRSGGPGLPQGRQKQSGSVRRRHQPRRVCAMAVHRPAP